MPNSLPNHAGRLASVIRLVCVVLGAAALSPICVWASTQEHASAPRLLTSGEGLTIVNAVRDYEQQARAKLDCSHLVHQIYLLAGIDYPYASSFDLYAGSENFRRVKAPQAGDLVIWPGHVGIVLDPAQHTFYSSVHSGLQAKFYDGPYWRARGTPRFYRYVIERPGGAAVGDAQPVSRAQKTPVQRAAQTVNSESPGGLPSASKQPRKAASVATARVVNTSTAAATATAIEIPPSILIATRRKQPTHEEIAEAISKLTDTEGNVLRADDPLKPRLPVAIFDDFEVERVEIKGNHGWAHVQLDSRGSIANGRVDLNQLHEKTRWELRHTESGWVVMTPVERAYVPRDVAVRILAAQLADLTQSDGTSNHQDRAVRQEAQLAALLDNLLNSK